jgi:hypothetical protein
VAMVKMRKVVLKMTKNKFNNILKEIHVYFGFLFDKGFEVRNSEELPMGDWRIVLASSDICIIIYSDEGEVNLMFSPVQETDARSHIGLGTMIYYLSHGEIYIGKYKRYLFNNRKKRFEILANLLRKYLDQIIPYFGNNFENYQHELVLAKQKYIDIFMDRYIRNRKPRRSGQWE